MSITDKIKKIMLVDDDVDLLEQNKMMLESKGFNVVSAESAEDGWKLFQDQKPDACIVDLIMEHHDSGFVLCHKIKRTKLGAQIPVFMLTSATYETGFKFSASTDEEKEWIKCDGIINKPVVVDELISKLENFLGE